MTVTAMPASAQDRRDRRAAEPEEKKGGLKKILIILVARARRRRRRLLVRAQAQARRGRRKPGEVVALDPIQINLADEHYLRIGIALQLTAATKEADGSKALDAAIDVFSGRAMTEVTDPKKRRALKKQLEKQLKKLYEEEVMGVYFTEFVTQ